MMNIPFNKPYYPPESLWSVTRAARAGTISGNGKYTRKVNRFFEERYGFRKALMTTSCTDALEMSGLLAGLEPGDEVILPSFTFVSTANAFALRGAKLVFADISYDVPNIDPAAIEALITTRTRVIVVVHYGGVACEMDRIMELASRYNLIVVEDAAHSVNSFYNGRPLGSIGHFGTFSFHETKNIFCGEGGLLAINDERFIRMAEIAWEKGTNRAAFYRGEVDKYNWTSLGSSFLPSDALASFLLMQLEMLDRIQKRRVAIWYKYNDQLKPLEEKGLIRLPVIPYFATVNGNMFYFLMKDPEERDRMMTFLHSHGIRAVFHYLPLHSSPYFIDKHDGRQLPNTDHISGCIVRLPFFYKLKNREIIYVTEKVSGYFG